MKVFILGGTGFIGSFLSKRFIEDAFEVILLVRTQKAMLRLFPGAKVVLGDPLQGGPWQTLLNQAEVVINLVGESIFHRWTEDYKKKLWSSRIESTKRVIESISPKAILFNASAVGYYGDRGEEDLTEDSPPGQGFVVDLCRNWEAEALKGLEKGVKVYVCRFGIVLGKGGGMLKTIIPIFKLGLGGRLDSGKQWFSWIHVEDIYRGILHLLNSNANPGVYNFTSPNPIRNEDLTKTLASLLKRPAFFPVPKFILRLIYGELAEVITASSKVMPKKLLDLAFPFVYPDFRKALIACFKS